MGFTSGGLFSGLSFWMLLTGNLHFLGFFAGTEDQARPFEQAVYDVHLLLHTVVDHLAFAI
jgi:hypothetical protein